MRTALPVALALAVLAGLFALTHPDYGRPNAEVFPAMVRSPAYESFSPNPVFPDGRTEQTPPEGTVARSPLDRAGDDATETAAAQARERGRVVFLRVCAPCHGPDGRGNGAVVRRGFPAPPDLTDGRLAALSEEEIAEVIRGGRRNMPPLAEQVAEADRRRVARYLHTIAGGGR